MHLSVEMDAGKGYGDVHKLNCRHLRDGEPIGQHDSKESVLTVFVEEFAWERDSVTEIAFAPCVKF